MVQRSERVLARMRVPQTRWLRRVVLIAAAVLVAACGPAPPIERTQPPASGSCPAASTSGASRLGSLAYVRAGALHVVDLATCADGVLVATGVRPPVAFSPSGGWIAFGQGSVVSAAGGTVVRSLGGPVARWGWSPSADLLAGVTAKGGLVLGGPERPPQRLYPDGSGISEASFSPEGSDLAVNVGLRRITLLSVPTATRRTAYRIPTGSFAGLQVAGWSPDGQWILFWFNQEHSSSLAADGLPLEAVPASGGTPVPVADAMLLYRDFMSQCGSSLVLAVGSDRYVTAGKRLASVRPPDWKPVDLSNDPSRSWFWPACSPDGRWVAATATRNAEERRFGVADRTIWFLAADGSSRHLLIGTEGDGVADEAPRWSADGRWLLFVQRERRPGAEGTLELARVEGTHASVVGAVATLPGEVGYYGHYGWLSASDWFQPSG